jgi:hypothetical protein
VMLAVSALAWALFAGIIAGSFLVLARALLMLFRGVKEFNATARDVSQELNRSMESISEQLRDVEEGLSRVGEGFGRKHDRRTRTY